MLTPVDFKHVLCDTSVGVGLQTLTSTIYLGLQGSIFLASLLLNPAMRLMRHFIKFYTVLQTAFVQGACITVL